MGQANQDPGYDDRRPWNAGKFIGAKRPLTPKQVSKVGFHLERDQRMRDLALFDQAIDSKLRGRRRGFQGVGLADSVPGFGHSSWRLAMDPHAA